MAQQILLICGLSQIQCYSSNLPVMHMCKKYPDLIETTLS